MYYLELMMGMVLHHSVCTESPGPLGENRFSLQSGTEKKPL